MMSKVWTVLKLMINRKMIIKQYRKINSKNNYKIPCQIFYQKDVKKMKKRKEGKKETEGNKNNY